MFYLSRYILLPMWVKNRWNIAISTNFLTLLCPSLFTDPSQIWRKQLTCSLHMHAKFHVNPFIVSTSRNEKLQFLHIWGATVPSSYRRSGPNLVCESRSVVYAYMLNFVLIWLFCCTRVAKTSQILLFTMFWTFDAQLQPSPIQWYLRRCHGEIVCTIAVVQKHNRHTNTQTNKKFSVFCHFWKSVPHQTCHGDRGPRARSCTCKTFGGTKHSFAARGALKIQIKTPITL